MSKTTEDNKYTAPYAVIVIDIEGSTTYADIYDDEKYAIIGRNYVYEDRCSALADRLFNALNFDVKDLEDFKNRGGYDVRVYDSSSICVYKAFEKLKQVSW